MGNLGFRWFITHFLCCPFLLKGELLTLPLLQHGVCPIEGSSSRTYPTWFLPTGCRGISTPELGAPPPPPFPLALVSAALFLSHIPPFWLLLHSLFPLLTSVIPEVLPPMWLGPPWCWLEWAPSDLGETSAASPCSNQNFATQTNQNFISLIKIKCFNTESNLFCYFLPHFSSSSQK